MIKSLPKQYKPSFWKRFREIFIKNEFKENIVEVNEKVEEKNTFKEKLNIDKIMKDNVTKEQVLKIIEENPELLKTLPIEKLEKINKIYDEEIQQATMKLNDLKMKLQQ